MAIKTSEILVMLYSLHCLAPPKDIRYGLLSTKTSPKSLVGTVLLLIVKPAITPVPPAFLTFLAIQLLDYLPVHAFSHANHIVYRAYDAPFKSPAERLA